MDANRNGANPGGKNRTQEVKDVTGAVLPVHDTNEWQDLADRADVVADERNEELEQLAGDEADWHPAPDIYEEP